METGSRSKIIIDKEMLKYLITVGTTNSEIAKLFDTRRSIVTQCIKEHGLSDILHDPEDDNVITIELQDVHDYCKILGELHARGVLRSKLTKVK